MGWDKSDVDKSIVAWVPALLNRFFFLEKNRFSCYKFVALFKKELFVSCRSRYCVLGRFASVICITNRRDGGVVVILWLFFTCIYDLQE